MPSVALQAKDGQMFFCMRFGMASQINHKRPLLLKMPFKAFFQFNSLHFTHSSLARRKTRSYHRFQKLFFSFRISKSPNEIIQCSMGERISFKKFIFQSFSAIRCNYISSNQS